MTVTQKTITVILHTVWGKSKEAQNSSFLKYSIKLSQSVAICILSPLYFKSEVNAVYQEILEYFMFPSTDKFYGDAEKFSTIPL